MTWTTLTEGRGGIKKKERPAESRASRQRSDEREPVAPTGIPSNFVVCVASPLLFFPFSLSEPSLPPSSRDPPQSVLPRIRASRNLLKHFEPPLSSSFLSSSLFRLLRAFSFLDFFFTANLLSFFFYFLSFTSAPAAAIFISESSSHFCVCVCVVLLFFFPRFFPSFYMFFVCSILFFCNLLRFRVLVVRFVFLVLVYFPGKTRSRNLFQGE